MKTLDAYLSAYEFSERHELRVDADPPRASGKHVDRDAGARRRSALARLFARYWRVVRPFSVLIRVLVLRAARRRAEAAA